MMPSIAEWVHRLPYYPFFPPPTHESPALIAEGSEVSHAARVLMAEAVRRVEAEGPLDDAQLLRTMAADEAAADADRGANSGEAWLLARGWGLGRRLGLDAQLQRWRGAGGLALALLVGLVVLAALGAAGTVVHSGRTVNAVAAFFTLLGLHGLTLAVWLIGLVAPWPASGGALGRLWLETVARFSRNSNPQAASLLSASLGLLRRERLAPCLFGWVSHTVWALSFGVVLAVLGFAFSFQAYRLTWETTILGPDFFVGFVQATGWLPGHLGFAVPDTATLLAPGAAAADQRAWAWWLIGCVAVYGLLPRAVLAAVCAWWWRRRARSLRLETSDPYYRVLLARREALQPAAVVDAEAPWQAPAADHAQPMPAGQGAALLGFELPPEAAWPPFALPAEAWSRRIAGTSSERVEVLEALRTARPARLLLACHAASSPDRGTARFVREAAASVGACRVLLVVDQPADTADTADTARWTHWLHGADFVPTVALTTDPHTAAAWLAGVTHG